MQSRTLTVSYTSMRDIIVPRIRLSGQWLRQAGFYAGDKITVSVLKGKLIIKLKERKSKAHG